MKTRNLDTVESIIYEEIELAIKEIRREKAPGHDDIMNEQIKYGGEELTKEMVDLFNNMIPKNRSIPKDWKLLGTIILHKKGDKHKLTNYKPICLFTTLAKIFSKILEKRIRRIINDQQPKEQAGYSTTDHLHKINILLKNAKNTK